MQRITRRIERVAQKVEREGARRFADDARKLVRWKWIDGKYSLRNPRNAAFYDVAFINGCDYSVPHPIRYRVTHQMEQLESNGLSATLIEARELKYEDVLLARSFIVFRCPCTNIVEEFIALAGLLNKPVYYDIDDLVIDTKYTDTIPFLDTFTPEERAGYDDGVRRMGRTLRFCGSAITTTEGMANELRSYVPDVFVNRNTASEAMLHYSERALYERDVLPYLEEADISSKDKPYRNWAIKRAEERKGRGCVIGYFSGSITHNDDFNMVLPALISVLESRPDTLLKVLGELDLPAELEPFADRIITGGFIPWQKLPEAIADVDINIAPLIKTVFNEAKSENKWVEAALVKVPTIASDIGAFKRMVQSGETGVLCQNTTGSWTAALLDLVDNPEKRALIGQAAYDFCLENCTTINQGARLANYIRQHQVKNVFFCLPSLNISGGILVVLQHCAMLQDAGYDVSLIDQSRQHKPGLLMHEGHIFPVYHFDDPRNLDDSLMLKGRVDTGVATLFDTLNTLRRYDNIGRIIYFVQNYETDFYHYADLLRPVANATYSNPDADYLTMSRWCESWLLNRFGKTARYIPNGIDLEVFYPRRRDFKQGKTRILIEGDSKLDYKNVDESFLVANRLDPGRYEIWYLSYEGEPKDWYRVDKFLHRVPHDEIADIYRQCHILLKTSLLESFSYPPLEMMATGGFVVVIPNEGNAEYVVDEQNCLTFEHGDIEGGMACVERVSTDEPLRDRLYENGIRCARERDWRRIESQIVETYVKPWKHA